MNVVYEDLAADPTAGFAAIGAFLDPDCPTPITPSERTRRQSDDLSAEWRRRALADLRDEDRWILEPQSW
jgi:LPS sulfotransferase NodH